MLAARVGHFPKYQQKRLSKKLDFFEFTQALPGEFWCTKPDNYSNTGLMLTLRQKASLKKLTNNKPSADRHETIALSLLA